MNKWTEMLTRNLGWKLLSLCLAVGLWLMVINSENPVESRNYGVAIMYQNQSAVTDADMLIRNWDDIANAKISIKVRGPRMSLDRLSQEKERITATVDLSKALGAADFSNPISVPIEVTLPNIAGDVLELESRNPSTISVQLEFTQTKEFPVKVTVAGAAADGYVLLPPVVSPDTVTVTGGEEELSQVSYVEAVVTVIDLKEDTVYTATPIAYNSEGAAVDGVTLSHTQVEVALSTDETKEVPIQHEVIGELPNNLQMGEITVTPDKVWVAGTKEALSSFDTLLLPAIDISEAEETVEQSYYLSALLPNGVRLLDHSTNSVVVKVELKPAAVHTMTLTEDAITADIRLTGGLAATYEVGTLPVTVKGPAAAMATLKAEDISAAFALEASEEGVYEVPLTLVLPDGVEPVGDYQVTVTVTAVAPQPQTQAEPPAETEPEE